MLLSAQGMEKHHGYQKADVCLEGLELTDTQKEQIQDIKTAFKKDQIKMEAELKLARLELHELMADEVTGGKLDKAIEKVNDTRSELFTARMKQRVEIRSLLTEEQREKLGTMIRAKMGHSRYNRFDRKRDCDVSRWGKSPRRHRR